MDKRGLATSQQPGMAHGATQNATQHVAATFIAREDAIGQQERGRAGVIRNDAERRRIDLPTILADGRAQSDARTIRVADADDLLDLRDQGAKEIRMEIVRDALHDGGDALEPGAGIDRRLGQRHHRSILLTVELHEHEVPDLQETTGFGAFDEGVERVVRDVRVRPLTVRVFGKRPVGGHVREIDIDLSARTTRTGVGHLPEVVLRAEPVNPVVGHVGHIFPQLTRLVVLMEDGDAQMLTRNLQVLGDELPGEADRITLEVVTEREVTEHLEEGVMARRVPDLFEVVVLASGAHAFLRRGSSPISIGGLLHAEKDLFELDHPCVRKEQGGIIGRNERGARADGVAILLEVGQESGADFGRKHRRENIDASGCVVRGLLTLDFRLPSKHLAKHRSNDAAAEAAALKKRD